MSIAAVEVKTSLASPNNSAVSEKKHFILWHVEAVRVIHLVFNMITCILFVIGSFGWVYGFPVPGTYMFAAGCILMAFTLTHGVLISMVEFKSGVKDSGPAALTVAHDEQAKDPYSVLHKFEIESALINAIGCILFAIGCFIGMWPEYLVHSDLLYLAGSGCFLFGSINFQILAGSFWGGFSPFWVLKAKSRHPKQILPIISGRVLNTLGSALFTQGSLSLFFAKTVNQGGWWYAIGSILFFLAAWGDFTSYVFLTLNEDRETSSNKLNEV